MTFEHIVICYTLALPRMLQILFAKEADERSQTFEKSLTMGFEYERRTKALILRSAMLKNQICVKVNSST